MQPGGMKQEAVAQEAGDRSSTTGLQGQGISRLLNFLRP